MIWLAFGIAVQCNVSTNGLMKVNFVADDSKRFNDWHYRIKRLNCSFFSFRFINHNSNFTWRPARTKPKAHRWDHHCLSLNQWLVLVVALLCYALMQFYEKVNSRSSCASFAIISRYRELFYLVAIHAYVLFVSVSNPKSSHNTSKWWISRKGVKGWRGSWRLREKIFQKQNIWNSFDFFLLLFIIRHSSNFNLSLEWSLNVCFSFLDWHVWPLIYHRCVKTHPAMLKIRFITLSWLFISFLFCRLQLNWIVARCAERPLTVISAFDRRSMFL